MFNNQTELVEKRRNDYKKDLHLIFQIYEK